jgi:hypothetical protein
VIELHRYRYLLDSHVWPLPDNFVERANTVCGFFLNQLNIVVARPVLSLGASLKSLVLLGKGVVATDVEASCYRVGMFDEANFVLGTGLAASPHERGSVAVSRLSQMIPSSHDAMLALAWFVVESLRVATESFVCGDRSMLDVVKSMLYDLPTAFSRTFSTQR